MEFHYYFVFKAENIEISQQWQAVFSFLWFLFEYLGYIE